MPEYYVEIVDTYSLCVEIEAGSEDEARSIAEEMWGQTDDREREVLLEGDVWEARPEVTIVNPWK
jgi:hypothetical protein